MELEFRDTLIIQGLYKITTTSILKNVYLYIGVDFFYFTSARHIVKSTKCQKEICIRYGYLFGYWKV